MEGLWSKVGGKQNVPKVAVDLPSSSMRSYRKHGTLSVTEDVFRDRAEQQLSQPLASARADYDKVNGMLPDEIRQYLRNFAGLNQFLVFDIVQRRGAHQSR